MRLTSELCTITLYEPRPGEKGISLPIVLDFHDEKRLMKIKPLRKFIKNREPLELNVVILLRSIISAEFPSPIKGMSKVEHIVYASRYEFAVDLFPGKTVPEEAFFPRAIILPSISLAAESKGFSPNDFLPAYPLAFFGTGTEVSVILSSPKLGELDRVSVPLRLKGLAPPEDFIERAIDTLNETWLELSDDAIIAEANIYGSTIKIRVPQEYRMPAGSTTGGAIILEVVVNNQEDNVRTAELAMSLIRRAVIYGPEIDEIIPRPRGFTVMVSGKSTLRELRARIVLARTLQEGWSYAQRAGIRDPYVFPQGVTAREILLPYLVYHEIAEEIIPLYLSSERISALHGSFIRISLSWHGGNRVMEVPIILVSSGEK